MCVWVGEEVMEEVDGYKDEKGKVMKGVEKKNEKWRRGRGNMEKLKSRQQLGS